MLKEIRNRFRIRGYIDRENFRNFRLLICSFIGEFVPPVGEEGIG